MANNFKISSFKEAIGAGSRPNLFNISVTGPLPVAGTTGTEIKLEEFSTLCRSASLPADSMGLIEIPMNAGRRIKLAGDRTFPDFTTTIINSESFTIRSRLELWQNSIVKTNFDLTKIGIRKVSGTSALTNGTMIISQLNGEGDVVPQGRVTLYNCWPSDISSIDLSYDTTDTIEEFTVTWTYDYHTYG